MPEVRTIHHFVCRRVSYQLGITGPSMVVDSACSSSLVAANLACSCLKECSQALVVGENLLLDPTTTVQYSQTQMMAADGQCKTFDVAANGYVRSEGCVVIALQAASKEGASQQHIKMLACQVNQDGNALVLLFCNP